jgi:hypothetical protein
MFILNWLPTWFFYSLFFAGLIGLVVPSILKFIPYGSLIQGASLGLLIVGAFMIGAIYDNDQWQLRVAEMQKKVAIAEAESSKENVKIVEKVVIQKQVIRQKGDEVIRYIDKEIIKYDSSCTIPKEFVNAHNKAVGELE